MSVCVCVCGRESWGDLAVLWLNLANAYGSIPHKLVEEALKRYHVLGKISKLILANNDNFQMRISSRVIIYDRVYSCGPPHMDVQEWDDQHELTYSSYVRTRDVTLKTCRRR